MGYLTTCDRCGFDSEACYVSDTWDFTCDLCAAIEAHENGGISLRSETRTMTHTSTRNVDSDALTVAALSRDFDAALASVRAALARVEHATIAMWLANVTK